MVEVIPISERSHFPVREKVSKKFCIQLLRSAIEEEKIRRMSAQPWKEVFNERGVKPGYTFVQCYHDTNGEHFKMIFEPARVPAFKDWKEAEAYAKSKPEAVVEFTGTVTGSKAHMLGEMPEVETDHSKRKYKATFRRTSAAELPDPERVADVSAQFDALEEFRKQLPHMLWGVMERGRDKAIKGYLEYAGDLVAKTMEESGCSEEIAKEVLREDPEVLKKAKAQFVKGFKTWHTAPSKNAKYTPDAFPGEKIKLEWPVFEKNTQRDMEGEPVKKPSRPLKNVAVDFMPMDKFSQLKGKEPFEKIEEQAPLGRVPTKTFYVDVDGPIKCKMVECPNGDVVPLWAHPWFMMLRSGKVAKTWIRFYAMDLANFCGVKVKVARNGDRYEFFMFDPTGTSSSSASSMTDSSAAAKSGFLTAGSGFDEDQEYQRLKAQEGGFNGKRPREEGEGEGEK